VVASVRIAEQARSKSLIAGRKNADHQVAFAIRVFGFPNTGYESYFVAPLI
jgi:hypothetical protein